MSKESDRNSQLKFFWFHPVVIKILILITFTVGTSLTLVGFLYNTNFRYFMPILVFLAISMTLFYIQGQLKVVIEIFLVGINLLMLIQGYFQKSAYVMTTIGIVFFIAGIFGEKRIVFFLFFLDLIVIIIYIFIDVLVFIPEVDAASGLTYVNNVTVLIPLLITNFIAGYIVSEVLIQTIEQQKLQYENLQRTSNQLIKQEKIRSIQVLSGGIAHDFNNILTSILGNLELISITDNIPDSIKDGIKDAKNATFQAQNLTRKLMEFSKSEELSSKKKINLLDFVEEVATFCMHGRKSKISFKIDENLHSIIADQTQISQIIQNLILNADESMKIGSTIIVSAKNLTIAENEPFDLPNGNYVILCVKDSGCGIKKEDYESIFNLFFSTKATGNGIGLSVCKKIATEHNGIISFESEFGKGSEFFLVLPALREKVD